MEKNKKLNYIDTLQKNNPILSKEEEEERNYSELIKRYKSLKTNQQLEKDLQKTINDETKDLPEIGFFEKVWWTGQDLLQDHFMRGWGKSIEGMIDTVIDGVGTVGSWFGASDQWAKDARSFDIHEFIMNNVSPHFSPVGTIIDLFTPGNETYEFIQEHPEYSWLNDGKGGQVIGDIAEGVGGILPSIFIGQGIGAIAGWAGASSTAISTATQIGSTASFGMGATGSATEQALKEGASYDEAKVYGLASGLMETGIEMISGGIGGVGKGVVQKVFPKLTKNTLVKFVSNAVGEGVEEMASELITPHLKKMIYNENAPTATTEQVLEAGLIGALVGSVMQGGQTLITPKGVRVGNNIQELVEVQNEYYEKGQFEKAEVISKKIKQLETQFTRELETSNIDTDRIKLETANLTLDKLDAKISSETLQEGEISKYQNSRDKIQQDYDAVLEKMESNRRDNYIIEKGLTYKYDLETGKVADKWNTYTKEQQKSLKEASDFVNKVNKRMDNKFKIVFNHDVQEGSNINSVLIDGDTILVNANADVNQLKQSVAKHEVTHALEKTKSYKTIKDIVLSIEKKNNDYERKMQQLRAKYAENSNIKDVFNTMSVEDQNIYLEQELVAEYVRENLFTSENSINRLAKENTSIAKRIFNFIKEKINLLSQDKDARETANLLKKAEKLYDKALKELDTQQTEKVIEKYSINDKNTTLTTANENKKVKEASVEALKGTEHPNRTQLIKTYANWETQKVFTMKELNEAIDTIMADVRLSGNSNSKNSVKVLTRLLYYKFNTIKENTKSKVRTKKLEEIATTIVEYSETVNGFTYAPETRYLAIDQVVGDLMVLYDTYGQDSKLVKFREKFNNKIKQLKDEKKTIQRCAKLSVKIAKLAKDIEKYKTNAEKDTIRSKLITTQMEGLADILSKIEYRDYVSGSVRQHVLKYKDKFYNEENNKIYFMLDASDQKVVISKEQYEKQLAENNDKVTLYVEQAYELDKTVLEAIELLKSNSKRINRKGVEVDNHSSLSEEELRAVIVILGNAKHIIESNNIIEIDKKAVKIDETAQQAIEIIEGTANFKMNMKEKYVRSLLNPRVIFKRLDNFNSKGVLTKLFNDIQRGETDFYRKYLDGVKEIDEFYKEHKGFEKSLRKKIIVNGKAFTKGEALSLLQLSNRKEAEKHIYNKQRGGIVLTGKNGVRTEYEISVSDINVIKNQLTETDNEYLKLVHKFFNHYAHNLKYDTDVKIKGYSEIEKVDEKNYSQGDYFPITSDFYANFKSMGNARAKDNVAESVFDYPFNKDLVKHANNAISVINIDTVVRRHARQVALYSSMYLPVRNMSIIWNKHIVVDGRVTTLMEVISYKWNEAYSYTDRLLKDIQSSYKQDKTWFGKTLATMRKHYTRFQLALNGQSLAKQVLALCNATYRINLESLVSSMKMKLDYEEMFKYCAYAEYRASESNVVKAEGLIDQIDSKMDNLNFLMEKYDKRLMARLYNACKVQISKETGFKVTSEECKIKAGELLEQTTRETQPISTSDKSSLLRTDNELVKQLLMFKSSPLQNLSLMAESIYELNALKEVRKKIETQDRPDEIKRIDKQTEEAKKRCFRAFASNIFSITVSIAITMAFKKLRRKEDDEEFGVEIINNFGSEISGMFPLIGEVYGYLFEGYEMNAPSIDSFNQALEAVKSLISSGTEREMTPSDLRKVLFGLGQVLGIPTRNLVNAGRSITNIFDKITGANSNESFVDIFYTNTNELASQKEDIVKYLNRNRTDKASKVVEDIFVSRGLVNTPELITKKYASLSKDNIFTYPKTLSNKINMNGVEYTLDDKQYSMIQKEYNKAHTIVSKAINFSEFSKLSANSQVAVMNKLYEAYWYKSVDNTLEIDDYSKLKLAILDDAIPMYKLVTYAYKTKELTKNKSNKKEVVKRYINSLPMSRVQKELMMVYLGYSVSNKPTMLPTIKRYLTSKGIVGEERDYILSLC